LPKTRIPLRKLNDKVEVDPSNQRQTATRTDTKGLFQPRRSERNATGTSKSEIIAPVAAIDVSTKKSVMKTRPRGMALKTAGIVMNSNDGPASG
jgi:hypothetical protein